MAVCLPQLHPGDSRAADESHVPSEDLKSRHTMTSLQDTLRRFQPSFRTSSAGYNHRIKCALPSKQDRLDLLRFKALFEDRYEGRLVPLLSQELVVRVGGDVVRWERRFEEYDLTGHDSRVLERARAPRAANAVNDDGAGWIDKAEQPMFGSRTGGRTAQRGTRILSHPSVNQGTSPASLVLASTSRRQADHDISESQQRSSWAIQKAVTHPRRCRCKPRYHHAHQRSLSLFGKLRRLPM